MSVTKDPPRRRRLSAQARRDQLLDVATEIVAREGFQAVSVQSVASGAGVTRPIVYEHFGTLQGLQEAIVVREMSRASEQIEQTALRVDDDGDLLELMLESLGAYLAAVASNPITWTLVLMPPEGAPASLRKRIVKGREQVLGGLAEAVRPDSLPGDLSEDPQLTARILSAMADEYARMVLEDPKRFTPGRLLVHARWWLEHVAGRNASQ